MIPINRHSARNYTPIANTLIHREGLSLGAKRMGYTPQTNPSWCLGSRGVSAHKGTLDRNRCPNYGFKAVPWRDLYQTAMLEPDLKKLPEPSLKRKPPLAMRVRELLHGPNMSVKR
jgi:hypothetical protein